MDAWKKKRDVMRRYDATAHMYDTRYAEEQISKIEAAFKHTKMEKCNVVLDVGCGTGVLFDCAKGKVDSIIGLDISRESLLRAKERVKLSKNAQLMWADADNMPFKNGVFSIVFAITILQNMPDPEKTLKELQRVAAANSQVIVTGLKKIFTKQAFERLLFSSGLDITSLEDENLECSVAVCAMKRPVSQDLSNTPSQG